MIDDLTTLANDIKSFGASLGFAAIQITDTNVQEYIQQYKDWISAGYQGDMQYLVRNQDLRFQPEKLHPGSCRIICVRMNYMPKEVATAERLRSLTKAYIATYALGRDYHKIMRKRLTKLAKYIQAQTQELGYRAFVDSAPILERPLAQKSGMGWIGKNTLLLNQQAGSWFLLGELFVDLPLPTDEPDKTEHCGNCTACLDVCPTKAFVKPWVLDARKCISYLTIEYKGVIPVELRAQMGNRVFGCDDCQIFCPWTKFASNSTLEDFKPRHNLDNIELAEIFLWSEQEFLDKTEGSAIRRVGYECWLRNIAVALGNAPTSKSIIQALQKRSQHPSALVREHTAWALAQHDYEN